MHLGRLPEEGTLLEGPEQLLVHCMAAAMVLLSCGLPNHLQIHLALLVGQDVLDHLEADSALPSRPGA